MPPQLEKNHVVPTAWQDEALARDGVSRDVPCSALKGETVPDSPLGKTLLAFALLHSVFQGQICLLLQVFLDFLLLHSSPL